MNKTDLLEVKKQFKYKEVHFSSLLLGAVSSAPEGSDHGYLTFTNEGKFLTREDEEQKVYLSLLNKAFSFSAGISSLDVPVTGDVERLLSSYVEGSSATLPFDVLVNKISESYPEINAYSIILFKGAYDIPIKDESKTKIGESDEAYLYFALMICPVRSGKSGLSPYEEIKDIVRKSDIAKLQPPVFGMIYPSFSDRSADTAHAFVCCKTEKERDLVNNLFKEYVPEPPKKEKIQIKTPPPSDDGYDDYAPSVTAEEVLSTTFEDVPDEDFESEHTKRIIDHLKKGRAEDIKKDLRQLDDYFKDNEKVNNIDRALQDKREEKYEDEEESQVIDVKEDKSIVTVNRVTERDIGGKKYFIIPKDLLPEDMLEKILSLGE